MRECGGETFRAIFSYAVVQTRDWDRVPETGDSVWSRMRCAGDQHGRRSKTNMEQRRGGFRVDAIHADGSGESRGAARGSHWIGVSPTIQQVPARSGSNL